MKRNKERSIQVVLFSADSGGLRGATVVDALDTLYVMELHEEFQEAKDWVEESFDLNVVSRSLNMFLCADDEDAWFVFKPPGLTLGSPHTDARTL